MNEVLVLADSSASFNRIHSQGLELKTPRIKYASLLIHQQAPDRIQFSGLELKRQERSPRPC